MTLNFYTLHYIDCDSDDELTKPCSSLNELIWEMSHILSWYNNSGCSGTIEVKSAMQVPLDIRAFLNHKTQQYYKYGTRVYLEFQEVEA